MQRMSEDMDRLFEGFGFGRGSFGMSPMLHGSGLWNASDLDRTSWTPEVETFRRGDNFVVRADLPGLKKEDVDVEIDDGMLTISGERTDEHEDNRDGYFRSERSYGRFYRAIPLPDGIDAESCDATFRDGVLEVTLRAPKDQRGTRKVAIK
jgi:HSP20 family protein